MSRHRSRQKLAAEFGATDIVAERGPDGATQDIDLLAGVGADCVLECVGTQDSPDQAVAVTRPGGMPLEDVAEGYRAMDERRAIKVLLRP
jgi:threonine dehydrogenase-like Zn-dependent dehydrogenase